LVLFKETPRHVFKFKRNGLIRFNTVHTVKLYIMDNTDFTVHYRQVSFKPGSINFILDRD